MKTEHVFVVAGVGVGLYLLWKSRELVQAGADALSKPIAYVISKLTLPANLHIPGGAILPDGGYVSWDAITQAGSRLDAQGMFVWRHQRFKTRAPRRADGNYDVQLS